MIIICGKCRDAQTVDVTDHELARHARGEYAQDVWPHLDADMRELIISGVCGPCFDAMFAE